MHAPPPDGSTTRLNLRAAELLDRVTADAESLQIAPLRRDDGSLVVDLGIGVPGGLEAGRRLAEICLAGLGTVAIEPPDAELGPWSTVAVRTLDPVAACLASQYAGWRISVGKFFAMGSGPMRAAAGREALFDQFHGRNYRERSPVVVGVLETSKLPPPEVVAEIAERCGVGPADVRLLVAPTASIAGTLQVTARSVETALHKLHELKFDVERIVSASGTAPLPPVAKNDLAAIGLTNDAILYGGQVTLRVRGDDASLEAVGPRVPSRASADHGVPFAEIFSRYGGDFYRIDPLLFSPAVVTLENLDTGRSFRYGAVETAVLRRSFAS